MQLTQKRETPLSHHLSLTKFLGFGNQRWALDTHFPTISPWAIQTTAYLVQLTKVNTVLINSIILGAELV